MLEALSTQLKRLWKWTPIGFIQSYRQLRARVYNRRWAAIEDVCDYLVGACVEGDYCEFGVYQGETFAYAANLMTPAFPQMRFFAFDSFEGLPVPKGVDSVNGFSSGFTKGQYACSFENFEKNLRRKGVDRSRVRTVQGWFDQTLTDQMAEEQRLHKVAAAWIDGDLYESTVPILAFLTTRISEGTIIVFDDWKVFRNSQDRGEQLACREWLAANPAITLRELFSFGHYGMAFTVMTC